MGHQIEIRNGEASMMYVGEEPWHGLGTKLDRPATSAEAIKAAKLDWQVAKKPLWAEDDKHHMATDLFAVVREDQWGKKEEDCRVLGVVGSAYTPLQNAEAFEFFDGIVGQGAAIYHTAGVLGHGERVWILAKLPSDICVTPKDVVNKYLLLSNSHDGTSAVQLKFTPIRVVCNNTLTMALRSGPTVRVAHLRDMKDRLAAAQHTLGIINRRYAAIGQVFGAMVKVRMSGQQVDDYLLRLFPPPADPDDQKAQARIERDRFWSRYFYENGKGTEIPGVGGTLWAAYNGISEYIDHRAITKDDSVRLNSVWFGDGYSIKARAYAVAEDRMRNWIQ